LSLTAFFLALPKLTAAAGAARSGISAFRGEEDILQRPSDSNQSMSRASASDFKHAAQVLGVSNDLLTIQVSD
jgi:hypothetical protein